MKKEKYESPIIRVISMEPDESVLTDMNPGQGTMSFPDDESIK